MNDSKENIHNAWQLDEDIEKLKRYYRDWADTYDADVIREYYHGPGRTVDALLMALKAHDPSHDKANLRVLDAGCGTGMVGKLLDSIGYHNLVGFDLSEEMVEKATQKKCYRELYSGVNLNQPLSPQIFTDNFDVVICVGVFTHGHVPPSGIARLLEVTAPNGFIALNARETYVEESNFEAYCEELESQGRVETLHRGYDKLVGESTALYWVAKKLK